MAPCVHLRERPSLGPLPGTGVLTCSWDLSFSTWLILTSLSGVPSRRPTRGAPGSCPLQLLLWLRGLRDVSPELAGVQPGSRPSPSTRTALALGGLSWLFVECVTQVGKLGGVSSGRGKKHTEWTLACGRQGCSPSRNCSALEGISQVVEPPAVGSARPPARRSVSLHHALWRSSQRSHCPPRCS